MRVGFTGTQDGMTGDQSVRVLAILSNLGGEEAHHGVCIGADAQFHNLACDLGYTTVGHPGVNHEGLPLKRAQVECDTMHKPAFYLVRNKHIVNAVNLMIAAPKQREEQTRGSGTWATIRYARKVNKPLVIVWPDGTFTEYGSLYEAR